MQQTRYNDLLSESASWTTMSVKILLVEDNPGDVVLVRELLKSSGIDFWLKHVSTLRETLLFCTEQRFDIILLDLGLPDSTGLETLKKIQLYNVMSPVVVMTGLDDEDIALESLRVGAQDYLVKSSLTSEILFRGIKYGIERKKIQDLLKKHARQFSLLFSATAGINESEDVTSVYNLVCNSISQLLDKAGLTAIELDDVPKLYIGGTRVIEPWFDQIKIFTGLDLHEPVPDPGNFKKELKDLFIDGKLHILNHGPGITPLQQSANELSINIYAIGFTRNNTVFGGVLIFTADVLEDDDKGIIETISNQVSLSLHRRAIEQDLKSSENRYRQLSKELELKVRERTRDLENSNYHLNQELVEHHLTEEALRKSEASLKELNATKDKFFNIIAHDLKNPFTSLLGSSELLIQNFNLMDAGEIRELVQVLNDSAKSGYTILQNLLDWSRSQTGLLTFDPENINLKELIDVNLSDLRLISDRKEISLSSGIDEGVCVYADRNMINAIVRNLLANAVKFTPKFGSVEVTAAIGESEVTISVKDTGIGIPQENINKLFRIDTKYTRPGTNMEQGTGLGLKLCKEFVELQRGKIWVESDVNKGSEFFFTVPVKET